MLLEIIQTPETDHVSRIKKQNTDDYLKGKKLFVMACSIPI